MGGNPPKPSQHFSVRNLGITRRSNCQLRGNKRERNLIAKLLGWRLRESRTCIWKLRNSRSLRHITFVHEAPLARSGGSPCSLQCLDRILIYCWDMASPLSLALPLLSKGKKHYKTRRGIATPRERKTRGEFYCCTFDTKPKTLALIRLCLGVRLRR